MASEQTIQQRIRLACSRGPVRLYRNNCGVLLDRRGVPVRYGLQPGSSDLIGWRTVTVTPDMVGQTVAVFCSLEVKAERGRISAEQQQWLSAVEGAGGIAGIVRSVEDAEALLRITTDQG